MSGFIKCASLWSSVLGGEGDYRGVTWQLPPRIGRLFAIISMRRPYCLWMWSRLRSVSDVFVVTRAPTPRRHWERAFRLQNVCPHDATSGGIFFPPISPTRKITHVFTHFNRFSFKQATSTSQCKARENSLNFTTKKKS